MPGRLLSALALCLTATQLAHAAPVVPGVRDDQTPEFAGRVLLSELNCANCHGGDSAAMEAKGAPDLSNAGARIRRGYLAEFIAAPHAAKPGTTMPDILGAAGLSDGDRAAAAEAISDFLFSLGGAEFKSDPVEAEAAERGGELFHQVGCVACHAPEGKALPGSPPLHRLAEKYSLASLTAFLEDPLAVRPGGRMPDLQLTHWEAADLASYLLRDQKPETPPAAQTQTPSPERIAAGRAQFEKFGCAQCHPVGGIEPKPAFANPLANLDASKPCAGARFDLSAPQQASLAAAAAAGKAEPKPGAEAEAETEARIRLTMARLNCIACHSRGDFGGPAAERDSFFTTSNLNLGEQARLPPPLAHVGAKLDPKWLRKVLVGGESVRPYMLTRMPRFGADNIGHLPDLFAKADAGSLPAAEFTRVKDQKEAQRAGHDLAGNNNLACIACHTFNGESATTLQAVEMTTMAERLQENWFHLYLRNPQSFHPSTIMPSFWPGGKPVRPEILDADAGKQIDAIWQYLARGREAPTPSGIRREPIEYDPPPGEAILLRRQYAGIGKRGIGVGYPSGINLAFDAAQMRLGSLWAGGFGEMSGVWRGQGSGNVHERSREVVRFAAGPALARLAAADAPWPAALEPSEKAEGFQFHGYTLDKKQRPTFRYSFGDISVADAFVDSPDGPSLSRAIQFAPAAPADLYFRAAADQDLKPGKDDATFLLPRGLAISVEGGTLRAAGDLTELIVPLAGKESLTLRYTFENP